MFGLEFTSKFPFIRKIKIIYKKCDVGGNDMLKYYESEIKINIKVLLDNRVPINKVRFVILPTFTYDVDNNVINPKYVVMHPTDQYTGIVSKNHSIIEIGKPENLITISVRTLSAINNYTLLKEILKKSKRGIVVYYVRDHMVRFADLDEEVEHYKNNLND